MADGNAPKRVFLRKVLYRIDFQLITEKMQEDLFAFVGQKFGEYFPSHVQEMEAPIEMGLNPNPMEQSKLTPKSQPVFTFSCPYTPECDGRQLKIGRTFLFLELTLTLESMKIPYYEWMSEIVAHLCKGPMFRLSRIGLRKFNSFFVLDVHKDVMNDLFSVPYLSQIDSNGFNLDSFQEMQVYNILPYTLNFHKTYSTGNLNNENLKIKNQLAHLVAFDFDLFTTDLDELSEFAKDAKTGLEKMNRSIYNFFIQVLNKKIVERINAGDLLEDYHIIPF